MDKNNDAVFLFIRKIFFMTAKISKGERKEMKVLIGTKNPGKIKGARIALEKYFDNVEIEGVKVDSGVGEQPVGLETYQGALHRVDNLMHYAQEHNLHADYFMAVESGLVSEIGFWSIINVAVIKNCHGQIGQGTSAGFPVPQKYVEAIKRNTLGTVMDQLFNESDLRSSTGGIGLLTREVITRIDLTAQAFLMALTPFINNAWQD